MIENTFILPGKGNDKIYKQTFGESLLLQPCCRQKIAKASDCSGWHLLKFMYGR